MKAKLLLMVTTLILIGCGQKKGTSDVSLVLGGLTSTGSINQLGGVILAGKNETTGQEIRVGLFLDGTENSFTLDKGTWKFAAVGWEGDGGLANKNFTGQARCAFTGFIELNAPEVTIPINLNTPDCNLTLPEGDRFTVPSGGLDSTLSNTFKKVHFHSCLSIAAAITAGECNGFNKSGTTNIGLTQSYKIFIPGGIEGGQSGQAALPGIDSRCIAIGEESKLRLPLGNGSSAFLDAVLLAYSEENCSGVPNIISFNEGGAVDSTIPNKITEINLVDPSNTSDIAIAFEHNEASANVAPIFGNGNEGAKTMAANLTLTVADYGEITSMIDDKTVSIAAGDGANIIAEDEVMVYVSSDDSCGVGYGSGKYRFARVKSKTGQNLEFFKPFTDIMGAPAVPSGVGTTPCKIQVVKVFNYTTYNNPGTFFHKSMDYDDVRGVGGIIAIRSNSTMSLSDGALISSDLTGPLNTLSPTNVCDHTIDLLCHPLGSGDGTNRAGGFIYIAPKELQGTAAATVPAISAGGNGSPATDNGSILVQAGAINVTGAANLEINSVGGNGGLIDVFYCNLSQGAGTLVVNSTNTTQAPSNSLCF